MESSSSLGGEQFDERRVVDTFDRRHPNKATIDYLLAIEVDIPASYEKTRLSMEAFFAAGHTRPEHGDESY